MRNTMVAFFGHEKMCWHSTAIIVMQIIQLIKAGILNSNSKHVVRRVNAELQRLSTRRFAGVCNNIMEYRGLRERRTKIKR